MNTKQILMLFVLLAFTLQACKKEAKTSELLEEVVETKYEAENNAITELADVNLEDLGIASEAFFKPLKVGAQAPNFGLRDAEGKMKTLADLTGNGPVAIVFYRGEWCPVCNKHLKALTEEIAKLEEAGVQLVAITPEPYESIKKMKEKTGANFMILSDTDAKVMKQYGVAFPVTEDYRNIVKEKLNVELTTTSTGDVLLPVPATVVVARTGKVIYSHFDPDYSNRASADDILSVL